MSDEIARRLHAIASDRESGAAEILGRANALLAEVLRAKSPLEEICGGLLAAQPSMAPIWNAVRRALLARDQPDEFDRYLQRVSRGPHRLVRHLVELFERTGPTHPLHLVTCSFSSTVLHGIQALARTGAVQVSCAEGRPVLEGRRLAAELAGAGIAVSFYTDAAVADALAGADGVLVGADAVTPDWFFNKVGTRMLAAAAMTGGVPVYVLATQDKFVSATLGARLSIRDGNPEEVWPGAPAGVAVRNPYFESTPTDHVAAVVSDVGVLGTASLPDACSDTGDDRLLALL